MKKYVCMYVCIYACVKVYTNKNLMYTERGMGKCAQMMSRPLLHQRALLHKTCMYTYMIHRMRHMYMRTEDVKTAVAAESSPAQNVYVHVHA